MKTIILLSIITTVLFSCKKYEDDDRLYLRSKKALLCHEWYCDTISNCLSIRFNKDGTFAELRDTMVISGGWNFMAEKEKIKLSYHGIVDEYFIIELTKHELFLKYENKIKHGVR